MFCLSGAFLINAKTDSAFSRISWVSPTMENDSPRSLSVMASRIKAVFVRKMRVCSSLVAIGPTLEDFPASPRSLIGGGEDLHSSMRFAKSAIYGPNRKDKVRGNSRSGTFSMASWEPRNAKIYCPASPT